MKRVNHLYTAISLTILVSFLSGCKKFDESGQPYPEEQLKACGIEQFIFTGIHQPESDTLTVFYNWQGDPVKITRPNPGTGTPNYILKYKNNRLSDFIGVYSNGVTSEFWHQYTYGSNGLVTIDSVFVFAQIVNGKPHNPVSSYAITFTYDSQNRIIYEKWNYPEGSFSEFNYQYNSNGNRVGGTYGDKVSFRRSHKIWMFLDRNYSVNNNLTSTGFNSMYMPKDISLSATEDAFLGNYYINAKLKYMCP